MVLTSLIASFTEVEVWMGEHYVENFIQSLIDTAVDANGGKMLDT